MKAEDALERMNDLMATVDTMERFKNIRNSFPEVVLIVLITFLGWLTGIFVINLADYITVTSLIGSIFSGNPFSGAVLVTPIFIISGSLAIYFTLNRAFSLQTAAEWREELQEGILGIIKIMSQYDWEKKLADLKIAREGFIFVAALQISLYFVIAASILLLTVGILMVIVLNLPSFYLTVLLALSVVIAIISGRGSLKKMYDRLWSADTLIHELRRFHSDFRKREV